MRALVCNEYGPPESLVIEVQLDPVPGKGEILVDVAAAGINFFQLPVNIRSKHQHHLLLGPRPLELCLPLVRV